MTVSLSTARWYIDHHGIYKQVGSPMELITIAVHKIDCGTFEGYMCTCSANSGVSR